MKKLKIFMLVFLCIFLMGCGAQARVVNEATKEAVLTFSEAKTDALLAGISANDYAAFSQDFDEEMLAGIPQDGFDKLKTHLDENMGPYISRKVISVIQDATFYGINYEVSFEKDANVKMRVVFRIAEPHKVSGLWFDE